MSFRLALQFDSHFPMAMRIWGISHSSNALPASGLSMCSMYHHQCRKSCTPSCMISISLQMGEPPKIPTCDERLPFDSGLLQEDDDSDLLI